MDSLFSILKIYRILLNFRFFHILIVNKYRPLTALKSSSFLYARLCVTKNSPKLASGSVRHNFMTY